jgi:DNA-3-methyladenine glycosylase II
MATRARGFDFDLARRHLARHCGSLGRWMRRIGPLERDFSKPFVPVDALARAILYQQLSGAAAATIVGRVERAIGRRRIDAAGLATLDDDALRACGVSRNKIAALRDLAAKAQLGVVPGTRALAAMDDEQIVEQLTSVRGIGRWTVEMMLMARLGRPDVLPIDDLGIRKGAQIVLDLPQMPAPKALQEIGERWAPYRTLASFYLWQVVTAAQPPRTAPKRSLE